MVQCGHCYLLNPLRAGSHIRPTPKNANVACPLQASSPGPNSTREPSSPALLISSTFPWGEEEKGR